MFLIKLAFISVWMTVWYIYRTMLLNEIEKEEKERHWYYSQLQGLSQRLAELPRIDTVRVADVFYVIVFMDIYI